jgi:ParB/RepB/Spo0J family partition protein
MREDVIEGIRSQLEASGVFDPAHALLVRPVNGHYEIIRGHHRKEAASRAGFETVPCWVREMSDEDAYMQLVLDNIQGELSPLEIGIHALQAKLETSQYAKQLGKSPSVVSTGKKAAIVLTSVRGFGQPNLLTKTEHLSIIGSLKHPALWLRLVDWLIETDASVTQTAAYVKSIKAKIAPLQGTQKRWTDIFLPVERVAFDNSLNGSVQTLINAASSTETVITELHQELGDELGYTAQGFFDWLSSGIGTYAWDLKQIAHYRQGVVERAEEIRRPPRPDVQPGEWWALGKHRLYCGDTARPDFYDHIARCDFAFADPPYNAGAAAWDSGFVWAHDWLIDKAPIVAVTPGIEAIQDFFVNATALPYRWSISAWITNGMTRGALGFGNWIYIALFAHEDTRLHRTAQDIIRLSIETSESKDTGHKGRKPSELMKQLIELFTEQGDHILDPFLGSGATLFAAAALNRVCIGGEIDPTFCNAIIDRWQTLTGQTAQRIHDADTL